MMPRLHLEPAAPEEEALCGAMLAGLAGKAGQLQLARDGVEPVGAAAIQWVAHGDPPRCPAWLAVAPGLRGRGLGRAIAERVAALVADEAEAIGAMLAVEDDGAAHRFARACGFEVARRTLLYRIPVGPFEAHMAAIVDRLRARTVGLEVVPLSAAPAAEVAALAARTLGTQQPRLHALLAMADPAELDKSAVVLAEGRVVGALVARWNGGHPEIEANVVDPAYRRGPVNALQLLTATRRGQAAGATHFTYRCDEGVTDSINLATRGGGELLRRDVELIRRLRR